MTEPLLPYPPAESSTPLTLTSVAHTFTELYQQIVFNSPKGSQKISTVQSITV